MDKPSGLTSHDVVARVRRIAGTRRAGHTGTLDPMATGVLVVCLGKATRLIPYIEETGGVEAKEYEARVRFGFETTTDDSEGEARGEASPVTSVTANGIKAALSEFVGEIEQVPPAFSAKKVAGERAYKMARRGETVDLKPVRVRVGKAELQNLDGDIATVSFACSRGTYIRALARDLGRRLGVGAHLAGLRRTRSGAAGIDQAIPLERLATRESLEAALTPLMPVLEAWPRVLAGDAEAKELRQGRAVELPGGPEIRDTRVRICDREGRLVALARSDGARLLPFCVF